MGRLNVYQGDIWIFLHPRSAYSTNTCFLLPLLRTNQHNLNGVASQKPTLGEQNKEPERLRHSSTQNTPLSVTTQSHLLSLPERPSLLQAEFPAWSGAAAPRSPAAASDRTQQIKKSDRCEVRPGHCSLGRLRAKRCFVLFHYAAQRAIIVFHWNFHADFQLTNEFPKR